MFKLSFSLLVAFVSGAPAYGKHALVHEKAVSQSENKMSDFPCPSANEAVCSGNGVCYKDGTTDATSCSSMALAAGDTNLCKCTCDPGWKGWDCFTVDTCDEKMDVTMDFSGVYYDFYKKNMLKQIKYKLTESSECSQGAFSFVKGTADGVFTQPFEIEAHKTTGGETGWSKEPNKPCGALVRKVGSLEEEAITVYFINPSVNMIYAGNIESHRMKVDGDKCKIFSWRIKKNSGTGSASWTDKAQALWETNGKEESFP
jgi:hypothetical protein